MDVFFLVLELIGAAAFAVSGAMTAIRRKMDLFGVCVLGLTTAVGGGVVRDIILGSTPPEMFRNPVYAGVALATCGILLIPHIRKFIMKSSVLMTLADAIGLGIFTVSGTVKAFQIMDTNVFLAVFVGVVTGVGGGLMRDVMAREIPYIFTRHIYATASIAGSLLFCLLFMYIDRDIAMLVAALFIVVIRMLAAQFKWNLPKPGSNQQ